MRKKCWNDGKCIFHKHELKKIKHFAKMSFSVFGGAHKRPLNTLFFFGKMFYYFFLHANKKLICHPFKIFFKLICRFYVAIWFFTIIHFKLSVTKEFFYVNQKRSFLDIQKITKATKLKKCPPKKFHDWFCYINIDFICF